MDYEKGGGQAEWVEGSGRPRLPVMEQMSHRDERFSVGSNQWCCNNVIWWQTAATRVANRARCVDASNHCIVHLTLDNIVCPLCLRFS